MADKANKSSGSEHTKAGDGRLFRNNLRDTDSTAGKHVADRERPPSTGGASGHAGTHRRDE